MEYPIQFPRLFWIWVKRLTCFSQEIKSLFLVLTIWAMTSLMVTMYPPPQPRGVRQSVSTTVNATFGHGTRKSTYVCRLSDHFSQEPITLPAGWRVPRPRLPLTLIWCQGLSTVMESRPLRSQAAQIPLGQDYHCREKWMGSSKISFRWCPTTCMAGTL